MPKIKIFILIIFLISSFFVFGKVEAGTTDNVSGWAWSENVGWISFNSTNCDSNNDGKSDGTTDCPPAGKPIANYGVHICTSETDSLCTAVVTPKTGKFIGYAWSENIGWITFNTGELTGCPSGICEARLDLTEAGTYCGAKYKVCGWAKVLSQDGISWPVWIKLREDTKNYGVWWDPPDNQELKGWAWGDVGVGWMSFNCENCEGTTCDTYPTCGNPAHPDYKVIALVDTTPPVVGVISPDTAMVNVSTNFSANVSDNIGVTDCWLYIYGGEYGEPPGTNDGNMTLSPSPCPSCTASKAHTFTLTGDYLLYAYCEDEAGNPGVGTPVKVTVTEFGPLICGINVSPDTGIINQRISINVSGSQGAITGVRFASDNNLDTNPPPDDPGNWNPDVLDHTSQYYGWNTPAGDWEDATSKIMKWSFAAVGNYEVWAELKDGAGNTRSCYDTILITECYPGEPKECTSVQGCTHTITCQPDGTWPPCPTDICTANTPDSILCPCPGIDGCVGNDYYDYPPYGDCNNYCSCDVGISPGQPCAPTIYLNDSRCFGVDQCDSDVQCDDGNPCTQNICNNPGAADSFCSYPNEPEGISCGICKQCDGNGNCINRPDGYDTGECGAGCQRCIYGFCQDYNQACAGTEASCECRSDSCIDCSDYYDGGCGYQGVCHCGPKEKPVWSCSNWQCQCDCQYDASCEWEPEPYTEVSIYPPSQEGNPGVESEPYQVTIINYSEETITYTITASVPSGWSYRLDSQQEIEKIIGPGQSFEIPLRVRPPEGTPSGEYDIPVTAQNEYSGFGTAKYVVPNQPPYKPTPSDGNGVSWDHCSVQALSLPTFRWNYSDPEGNPQAGYQIRIDDDIPATPEFTDSKDSLSHSYTPSSTSWGNWMHWNTDYWWMVKVKDNQGNWSDWSDPTQFSSPLHAAPWPDFSLLKERVSQNEVVTAIDASECYTSGDAAVLCQGLNVTYEWDFDYDGSFNPVNRPPGNTNWVYSDLGQHTVVLRITDNLATCYSEAKTLTVTLPLPKWKEIAPF